MNRFLTSISAAMSAAFQETPAVPPQATLEIDARYLEDLARVAVKLEAGKGSGLMGSWLRKCEAEVLVDQTVRNAARHVREGLGPYSFVSGNATLDSYGGPKNGMALNRLHDEGYFVSAVIEADNAPEGCRPVEGGYRVVYPTRRLLYQLLAHFNL